MNDLSARSFFIPGELFCLFFFYHIRHPPGVCHVIWYVWCSSAELFCSGYAILLLLWFLFLASATVCYPPQHTNTPNNEWRMERQCSHITNGVRVYKCHSSHGERRAGLLALAHKGFHLRSNSIGIGAIRTQPSLWRIILRNKKISSDQRDEKEKYQKGSANPE